MTFHVVYLKGHFLAHVIFLLYLCSRKGFSVLSQSMEKLLLDQLKCPIFLSTPPKNTTGGKLGVTGYGLRVRG